MKVNDLILRLREDYLDDTLGVETDDALVSEPALIRFASEAQLQACRRMDVLYDEVTTDVCDITLVDGQSAYPFHSSITKLVRVSYNNIELIKTTEANLDLDLSTYWRQADPGVPLSYYVRGTTIYLYPAPSLNEVGTPLKLSVYRKPLSNFKSGQQSFEIFEEAQDDLIYWMLYRVYNLRDEDLNDPTAASMYHGLFTESYGEVVPLEVRLHQFETPERLRHINVDKYTFTNTGNLNEEDPDFSSNGWE